MCYECFDKDMGYILDPVRYADQRMRERVREIERCYTRRAQHHPHPAAGLLCALPGFGTAPLSLSWQLVDLLAVRLEPGGVSITQFALAERCPSIVDISSDCGGAHTTTTDGAARRVPASKQLNLSGHVGNPSKEKKQPLAAALQRYFFP